MKRKRAAPFRANEAADAGREEAIYLYTRALKDFGERKAVIAYIDDLIERFGPVVDGYPSWHPFTFESKKNRFGYSDTQGEPRGFEGLDHTIYFRDAFVTAPYGGAKRVVTSVYKKESDYVDAEEIRDALLYNYGATPVLVKCRGISKEEDGTISKRFALANMLSSELLAWEEAECGESWEDMRRYILGTPCGSRSSLFVNQDTGQALREVYELLNRHELFGPPRR
jgi:hypothetical protein